MNIGAIFNDIRTHRYELHRIWNEEKPLLQFIGLNPSTANERTNDNTIIKITKITSFNGYGGFYMTNLFTEINSKPVPSIFEQDNSNADKWLNEIAGRCDTIIFCWGNFKQARKRASEIINRFGNAFCIKQNLNGSPKHPLYCLDVSTFVPFNKSKITYNNELPYRPYSLSKMQ